MTVYLLRGIAEESKAAFLRDCGCERTQHHGREILPLVYDYMTVAAFFPIGLKFVEHGDGQVVPVVPFAAALPLLQITAVEVEQHGALGSRNAVRRPAYAFCVDIALLADDAVLLYPLELILEKFLGTLQNRALPAISLRFAQRKTDEPQPIAGSADALLRQLVSGKEVSPCEPMVVFDKHRLLNCSGQVFHIGDETLVERHQKRPSAVVG